MKQAKRNRRGVFVWLMVPALFLAGFFISAGNAEAEGLKDNILDIFPFAINNNFDSVAGRDAGFRSLSLQAANPFDNKYDRSFRTENNQTNYPAALSSSIGVLSGDGLSVSWWYRWDNYSGAGHVEVMDENQKRLLGANLGVYGNGIYIPEGAAGIEWDRLDLSSAEMGDGQWHQFILSSDGQNIKLYLDGQERASGSFTAPISYANREIKYVWLSGGGSKSFDEVILWNKYLTLSEAEEIYSQGSFYDFPAEAPVEDLAVSNIQSKIIDAFPLNNEYSFNSLRGLNNGFLGLQVSADNPFSADNDWSMGAENNQGANWPYPMSGETRPISGQGFSVSWWYKWVNFSGSIKIEVKDQNNHTLLSGYWGSEFNIMYAPEGSGGIFWQKYDLNKTVMGDGNWHQFAAASDGQNISIYFDGEEKAKGTFNNVVDYKDRLIKYLWVSGCGTKRFDEIVFWDKFLTPNDAQLLNTYGSVAKKSSRNPVIIVPGIMGSTLKEKGFIFDNEIWPDPATYIADLFFDQQLDKLKMDENGNSLNNIFVTDVIRKISAFDFYGGLIDYLKANGYEENKDLFVFSYDWRIDLDQVSGDNYPCESTTTLKCLIDEIKQERNSTKVDIVAHSMGGLVVKNYVAKFGQGSIDKFVDIATPHLGAPKAVKILNYGDNMDMGIFVNGFGVAFLNENKIKEISLRMSSIYQLLPSEKYFNISENGYGHYLYNDSKIGGTALQGELNYLQSLSYLTASNNKITSFFVNKNSLLHSQIDDVVINNSYNISGCGTPTIGRIKNLGKKMFFSDKYEIEYVDGDGTVPLRSSDYYGDKKYYFFGKNHSQLPGTWEIKDFVYAILNGQGAEYPFTQSGKLNNNTSVCGISGKVFEYHCPVDLHVYDEQGNHVGPAANGDIENNIPGVQYDIIEGNKFAFLPAGGNYRITGEAVGTGALEVVIKTIENDQYIETKYFNSISLQSTSTRTEINFVSGQENLIIKIDENGDGIFEKEKMPDTVLTGGEMNDLIKPITAISMSGAKGENNYYLSDLKISFSATDDNSGILKTEYSLDGGNIWINYAGEFTVSREGMTTILYSSTDRAGNREENKETVIKIDKMSPAISILLPQENQEISRNKKLSIEYFAVDDFSGVATSVAKIYFDGQMINSNIVDLFGKNLGLHKVKISIQDLSGNQADKTIAFYAIIDINGAIADVNRAYDEKLITKFEVKNDLVSNLSDIKAFQEKYGQRIEKEKEMRDRAMAQCLKYHDQTWCNSKIGELFGRIEYGLSKINQAVIKLKYNLILAKLDMYLRAKWINQAGYTIIKEDIKYLLNKI